MLRLETILSHEFLYIILQTNESTGYRSYNFQGSLLSCQNSGKYTLHMIVKVLYIQDTVIRFLDCQTIAEVHTAHDCESTL